MEINLTKFNAIVHSIKLHQDSVGDLSPRQKELTQLITDILSKGEATPEQKAELKKVDAETLDALFFATLGVPSPQAQSEPSPNIISSWLKSREVKSAVNACSTTEPQPLSAAADISSIRPVKTQKHINIKLVNGSLKRIQDLKNPKVASRFNTEQQREMYTRALFSLLANLGTSETGQPSTMEQTSFFLQNLYVPVHLRLSESALVTGEGPPAKDLNLLQACTNLRQRLEEAKNTLEEMGYPYENLSKEIDSLTTYIEQNTKKGPAKAADFDPRSLGG